MNNFKQMLDSDLKTTFYNTSEFAEMKKIKCDGEEKTIPVVFDLEEAKNRKTTAADHVEGMHRDSIVVRIQLSDFTKVPRHGMRFFIDDVMYLVINVQTEYNELIIDLERHDE